MKLLVGLGNPGEKYENNRHNVGFMFVDYLARAKGASWKYDKYVSAQICMLSGEIILAKPQTFMNRSGESVKKLLEKFDLKSSDLIVVHDDLDIPLNKFKLQLQGPKLHNGLTSIQDRLRTMDFMRIRIGVDARSTENRMPGEEFVLQNFTKEELLLLPEMFKKIELRFEALLQSENSCS